MSDKAGSKGGQVRVGVGSIEEGYRVLGTGDDLTIFRYEKCENGAPGPLLVSSWSPPFAINHGLTLLSEYRKNRSQHILLRWHRGHTSRPSPCHTCRLRKVVSHAVLIPRRGDCTHSSRSVSAHAHLLMTRSAGLHFWRVGSPQCDSKPLSLSLP